MKQRGVILSLKYAMPASEFGGTLSFESGHGCCPFRILKGDDILPRTSLKCITSMKKPTLARQGATRELTERSSSDPKRGEKIVSQLQ